MKTAQDPSGPICETQSLKNFVTLQAPKNQGRGAKKG